MPPNDTMPDLPAEACVEASVAYAATLAAHAFDSPDDSIQPGSLDESVVGGLYRIERQIGVGGMGRVFQVRHRRLGGVFALKLMRASQSTDARARDQFFREARLASTLSHPNIVSVIDYGEDPDLGAFMLMDLIDGEPLSAHLARGAVFEARVACDLGLQLCEALEYLHGQDIVHGDVKAENLLLATPALGERRRHVAKLLDFGLARLRSPEASATGSVGGTPGYLSPERISGAPPSVHSDVYALGALCYEMLAGRLPFEGPVAAVMNAHLHDPPPPFAERTRAAIPRRLEALVLRTLAKAPAERPASISAVAAELREIMEAMGMARRRPQAPPVSRLDAGLAAARAVQGAAAAMARLDIHGTIREANRELSAWLTGDPDMSLVKVNVRVTRLVEIWPELTADLRRAIVQWRTISVVLAGRRLSLVPRADAAGEAYLYAHALESEAGSAETPPGFSVAAGSGSGA